MGLYPRNGPGERVSFPCFRFFPRRTNDLMVMMTVARDGRRRAEQEDDEGLVGQQGRPDGRQHEEGRHTGAPIFSFWQNFGKISLVFGCIKTKFCK